MDSLKRLIAINIDRIDEELTDHAPRFSKIAEHHAMSVAALQRIEAAIDFSKSNLSIIARKGHDPDDPENETIRKWCSKIPVGARGEPTEDTIKSAINTHDNVLELRQQYLERLEEKVFLDDLIKVMEARTTMLVHLSKRQTEREGNRI